MNEQKWTAERISDQRGKVAIVTGSSSGIGLETARVLADKGATVVVAVRSREKGERAIAELRRENARADVSLIDLDLADLASVRRFADDFRRTFARLDFLVNNAGVMIPPYSKTKDGFELQFGTNHLGHFALTGLLLDSLLATPGARVVNVSSSAHRIGSIDFDDLAWERRRYSPWRAYGASKIANLYFTYELDRRFRQFGADALAAASHPGWTATDLQRHTKTTMFLNDYLAMKGWQGALPTLRAATDPGVVGGDYYGPDGFMEIRGFPVRVEPKSLARDLATAKRLWDESERLTGVGFDFAKTRAAAG